MSTSAARVASTWLIWAATLGTALAAPPIKLGVIVEGTGAHAEFGVHQLHGAQLAVEEINSSGGVLGRPLELEAEDSQSTNPGSVRALSKILQKKGSVAAVIGPTRSTQVLAMMPSILKARIPTMVGGTAYILTHASNPWIFRVRPHDGYSARLMADYGVITLKKSRWAIVHSTETFGIGGKNRLIEALRTLGLTPVSVQAVSRVSSQELSPTIRAIKQADADIVAAYIPGPHEVAAFAVQLRDSGVSASLIGSAALVSEPAVRIGGAALHDSYVVSDFFAEATPESQDFSRKYREKYGAEASVLGSWTYDAVNLLALAIRNANGTDAEGIRKAMLGIQGHRGAEGTFSFDRNGDGLHGYNLVKNDHGKIVFIKHVSFSR